MSHCVSPHLLSNIKLLSHQQVIYWKVQILKKKVALKSIQTSSLMVCSQNFITALFLLQTVQMLVVGG